MSREHVRAVHANGRPVESDFINGHIVIPGPALSLGANTLRIAFNAGDPPLNRHEGFMYTLFVPARARQAIPCFDQPDLKGRWTLRLEHPAHWKSVANGAEIERTQAGGRTRRIKNSDRKAQFEFVRSAVSADPDERSRWFAALKNLENRRQERWVLEGIRYLHHPLRAKWSLQFIRPSLDLLEEVHATSNLGFPAGWVSITLAGHNSGAAADIVASFLSSCTPAYPKHLRDATLIAADMLFRSARIGATQ